MMELFIIISCIIAYISMGVMTAGRVARKSIACDDFDCRKSTHESIDWVGCGPHHSVVIALLFWPLYITSWLGIVGMVPLGKNLIIRPIEKIAFAPTKETRPERIDRLEKELKALGCEFTLDKSITS